MLLQVGFVDFVLEHRLHSKYKLQHVKEINATGGGAFKYAQVVNEKLGMHLWLGLELQG